LFLTLSGTNSEAKEQDNPVSIYKLHRTHLYRTECAPDNSLIVSDPISSKDQVDNPRQEPTDN
jgi:hypothetical protein